MPTTEKRLVRKTRPFRNMLAERLANPHFAVAYLNATMDNNPEGFLAALKDVAEAREAAGRILSVVEDDASVVTISSILKEFGLRLSVSEQRPDEEKRETIEAAGTVS